MEKNGDLHDILRKVESLTKSSKDLLNEIVLSLHNSPYGKKARQIYNDLPPKYKGKFRSVYAFSMKLKIFEYETSLIKFERSSSKKGRWILTEKGKIYAEYLEENLKKYTPRY